ncbi:hypothetical protein GQ42DRAFT_166038 [Ramicandelaber brevisporus]|nr:hypothetical protein GQ42DRAFT_166041 [Ramicandelaber brevisporus]KAI8865496.1 hypothetical protein GQ42DRAFT_166038 [Ramicandelaber brevisporus]
MSATSFDVAPALTARLVPASTALAAVTTEPRPHRIVVGIAVQAPASLGFDSPRVLIVQRAAEVTAFANQYELPGGKVEDDDESILHGAARELLEETNLNAIYFTREFEPFTYLIPTKRSPGGTETHLQLNFVVQTDDVTKLRLNPREHQASAWASLDEIQADRYPMTSEMKDVVVNALKAI